MLEVEVNYLSAVQFEAKARKHLIRCDQPAELGGSDTGMPPPELLLASLGTCAAYYAVEYLKKHNLLADGTRVHVSAEKERRPFRLDNFHIDVKSALELTEEHRVGMERAVHHCLIHQTLVNPPKIEFQIKGAPALPEVLQES